MITFWLGCGWCMRSFALQLIGLHRKRAQTEECTISILTCFWCDTKTQRSELNEIIFTLKMLQRTLTTFICFYLLFGTYRRSVLLTFCAFFFSFVHSFLIILKHLLGSRTSKLVNKTLFRNKWKPCITPSFFFALHCVLVFYKISFFLRHKVWWMNTCTWIKHFCYHIVKVSNYSVWNQ